MDNQLSQEDIETIRKAKEVQQQLGTMGVPVEESSKPEEEKVYENFVEIEGLPSRGVFYKTPITGQSLKIPDLLQIQGITDDNVTQRFTEIFSRRIRGISPLELLSADELYISLWLRASSFPGFTFPHSGFTCSKCNTEVHSEEADFDFRALSITSNIDEIIKLYGNSTTAEFELSTGRKFKIFLKQRKHDVRMDSIIHRDFGQYNRQPDDDTLALLELVSVLDTGVPDLRESAEFVKNELTPVEFVELLKQIDKYSLTSEIVVNCICPDPNCKEATPMMGYPFHPDIYLPIDQ